MINMNIKEEIRKIIIEHPTMWARILKSKANKYLFVEIEKYVTEHKLSLTNIGEILYWYLNELIERPKCKHCKTHEISKSAKCHPINGYTTQYCSISCSQKDPETQNRIKENNKKKYDVEHPQQTKKFKEKFKNTISKRTIEERQQINEHRKTTCQQKYGCDNISQVKDIADKKSKTFRNHTLEQREQIRTQTIETLIKKYGENYNKVLYADYHNISMIKKSYRQLKQNTYFELLLSEEEFIDLHIKKIDVVPVKCRNCGTQFGLTIYNFYHSPAHWCPKCKHYDYLVQSKQELEISKFIEQYVDKDKIIISDKTLIAPQEIDIYIPEKKLAIEYDGLYWHSDEFKHTRYHVFKTELCEKQDVQLIHIFENEWILKPEIVKSRIKNLLGIYDTTIFARKCEVKIVDVQTSREFQEHNHIQGAVNAKAHLGLYFDNELISLMTFGKCRFDKKHEWELLRFCNKLGYHIPGAAGKLLKYFEQNYQPKSLVSYADRRWSRGKVYEALGFIKNHSSSPNYWYFDNNGSGDLLSRVNFQKHMLKDKLEIFDESKTEVENMRANGYRRIFDCGNLVYEKIY